jgi:hypothetical protein
LSSVTFQFVRIARKASTAQFMRDERLLASESHGARLMTAAPIERYTATAGTPHKLETHRATMRASLPSYSPPSGRETRRRTPSPERRYWPCRQPLSANTTR